MDKITMRVAVHKAKLALMRGETLDQFTQALSGAGSAHIMGKLKMTPKSGGSWLAEAYSDRAVFSAYRRDVEAPSKYYAVDYSRDSKTGAFTFGDMAEVKRMTVFKPVENTAIMKSIESGIGGWEPVSKPFPNFHAARQTEPKGYSGYARGTPTGFPAGVSVVYGIKTAGGKKKSEIQSIRFDAKKWPVDKAKKWLKEHKFKTAIEQASKPTKKSMVDWSNVL